MSLHTLFFLQNSSFSYKSTGISYVPVPFLQVTYLLNFLLNSEAKDIVTTMEYFHAYKHINAHKSPS